MFIKINFKWETSFKCESETTRCDFTFRSRPENYNFTLKLLFLYYFTKQTIASVSGILLQDYIPIWVKSRPREMNNCFYYIHSITASICGTLIFIPRDLWWQLQHIIVADVWRVAYNDVKLVIPPEFVHCTCSNRL